MRSNIPLLLAGLLLLGLLAACSAQAGSPSEWQVTPTFDLAVPREDGGKDTYSMRGEEGRFGFIDTRFIAGRPAKALWHFWGEPEQLVGKQLRVVGVSRDGQTAEVFEGTLNGPNFGATAHVPSGLALPSPGLWRLDVYVGDEQVGSVVIEVEKATE